MNILLGDVHGKYSHLLDMVEKGLLDGSHIYCVGDFGLGFSEDEIEDRNMFRLNNNLDFHDVTLHTIRGNHDCPYYWTDPEQRNEFNEKFDRIELIPDYTSKEIDGKSVLFIGGAISIDRANRQTFFDTHGTDIWWEDEVLVRPTKKLKHHDIIIAHTTPSFFNIDSSGLKWWFENDPSLEEDLKEERQIMDDVFYEVRPERFYSGHFHNTMRGEHDGCVYRCIDTNEIVEF